MSCVSYSVTVAFSAKALLGANVFVLGHVRGGRCAPGTEGATPSGDEVTLHSIKSIRVLRVVGAMPTVPADNDANPGKALGLLNTFKEQYLDADASVYTGVWSAVRGASPAEVGGRVTSSRSLLVGTGAEVEVLVGRAPAGNALFLFDFLGRHNVVFVFTVP